MVSLHGLFCIQDRDAEGEAVFPAGSRYNVQPMALRAPEVWLGQACSNCSQIWAVAAMLFCWIKPGILGSWGSPHSIFDDMWSMAKVKRLFPGWDVSNSDMSDAVNDLTRMEEMEAIAPFPEEVQKVDMPQNLKDLLHTMLVTDPEKRPSATSVLASKEFRAFGEDT